MSINRRESYVIHFYHDKDGNLSARITDSITQQSWTVPSAFQLRMIIAGTSPVAPPTNFRI